MDVFADIVSVIPAIAIFATVVLVVRQIWVVAKRKRNELPASQRDKFIHDGMPRVDVFGVFSWMFMLIGGLVAVTGRGFGIIVLTRVGVVIFSVSVAGFVIVGISKLLAKWRGR